MTPTKLQMMLRTFTECIICERTLGEDSRSSGVMFCHDHLKCEICGDEISPSEAKWCYRRWYDLTSDPRDKENIKNITRVHTRCTIPQEMTVPIKQTDLDFLNLIRLLVIPDMDLDQNSNEKIAYNASVQLIKNMNIEQTFIYMKKIESCLAQIQVARAQNPSLRKTIDAERTVKARTESVGSAKSSSATPKSAKEVELSTFMELHGLEDRKEASEVLKERNKAIKSMMAAGFQEEQAREMTNAMLLEQGRIKK